MIRKPITQKKSRNRPTKKRRVSLAVRKGIAETVAVIHDLKAPNLQAARILALLQEWLQDDSGYDEEALPELKKALDDERRRVGARRLFDD